MMSYGFIYSPELAGLPRDGELKIAAPALVAVPAVGRLYFSNLDHTGAYVRSILLAYPVGTTVYVERDPSTFASFRIRSIPIGGTGFVEIPVLTVASSGVLDAGLVDVSFIAETRELGRPRDAATDPDLVTLATAKAHLRVTDNDHDVDIQQKTRAASATIRDYLKSRNDETWTPETCPPWIAAAVLLLLAHLYEHRGDEFGNQNDNDARVWAAIANLCRRSRDPALA